jgi:hypothetical protein
VKKATAGAVLRFADRYLARPQFPIAEALHEQVQNPLFAGRDFYLIEIDPDLFLLLELTLEPMFITPHPPNLF